MSQIEKISNTGKPSLFESTFFIQLIGISFFFWALIFWFLVEIIQTPCSWLSDSSCSSTISAIDNSQALWLYLLIIFFVIIGLGLMKIKKWAKIPALTLLLISLGTTFIILKTITTLNPIGYFITKLWLPLTVISLLSIIYLIIFRGEWKSKQS